MEEQVKEPKEELIEITDECDSDKDVIPKEEISTTRHHLLDQQIVKPLKIKRIIIISKEFAALHKLQALGKDKSEHLRTSIKSMIPQSETSLSANHTQTDGTPSTQKIMSCEDKKVHQTTVIKNRTKQKKACRLKETEKGLQNVCSKTEIIEPQNKKAKVINVKQSVTAPHSYNNAIDTAKLHNAVYRDKEDQPNTLKSDDHGMKDISSGAQGSRSRKVKVFVCDLCQASFTRKARLVRHLWCHTGEKPFSCNYCEKKFGRKHHLKFHTRIHTGHKPYTCQHCQYKSVDKTSLGIHMRTHTGEKPFACQICDKRFTQKYYVKIHMRIHTGEKPYYCKHCSFKCSYHSYLTVHMRSHTGEKPYSCEYCQSKFPDNSSMRNHIRSHTGEKFYKISV